MQSYNTPVLFLRRKLEDILENIYLKDVAYSSSQLPAGCTRPVSVYRRFCFSLLAPMQAWCELGKAELHEGDVRKAEGRSHFAGKHRRLAGKAMCYLGRGAKRKACSSCPLSCPTFGLTSYHAVVSGCKKEEGASSWGIASHCRYWWLPWPLTGM